MMWRRFGTGIMAVTLAAFVAVITGSGGISDRAAAATRSEMTSAKSSASVTIESAKGERLALFDMIDHEARIISPRDAASGLPTGKRQHSPFVIHKRIDKSTPLLMKALVNNEVLDTIVVELRLSSESLYRVRLSRAHVIGIEHGVDGDGLPIESLSLNFEKIQWTYFERGGEPISAEDQVD